MRSRQSTEKCHQKYSTLDVGRALAAQRGRSVTALGDPRYDKLKFEVALYGVVALFLVCEVVLVLVMSVPPAK